MCGIFGYTGARKVIQVVMEGLKSLEYRGYDSAGFGGVQRGSLMVCKEVGRVCVLEQELERQGFEGSAAVAQTRWATHGKVTKLNAHPHVDERRSLAVVHNGIIENCDALSQELKERGVVFTSETDTEVIAHLVAAYYHGDLLAAVQQSVARLKGAYAAAIVHCDFPDQIVAIAHESPLAIGIGDHEAFLSSDPRAFASYTHQAIYLSNAEIALIKADSQQVYAADQPIDKKLHLIQHELAPVSKGEFEHYTLKEIHEQPHAIRQALLSRFLPDYGTALFEELTFSEVDLSGVERLLILACGTSWHAGCVIAYMLEDLARLPVQVEISSEFRYKNPIISPGTLVLAISQSGETADTVAAVREAKAKGARVVAFCNVHHSQLVREADQAILLKAGDEVGVCSTKAFTNQIIVLSLFTLLMARMRHMGKAEGQRFLEGLLKLPEQVEEVIGQADRIAAIAGLYAEYQDFFYIGRRYMYPACLEGALKLKEIAYVNANGYPAGEMKHGPIALISEACPTVALCADPATHAKLLGNLREIKARHGKIVAVATAKDPVLEEIADDVLYVPASHDALTIVPVTVALQLFAYYVAKKRGADIDCPRNLAKSVTVE